ncbi:MAG: hypothetical protein II458_09345 [Oscillospiraceae bacterium]|nr:hypothetical protein [Oscillospiraceae bacterium]
MQIEVHDEKKLVCVWLTGAESTDMAVGKKLNRLYEKYKQNKYMVAVFHSGDNDLEELTGALLRYNRRMFAEREVQAEKQNSAPQM